MRIVLDTNVFISGIFFGGPPSRILGAWRDGRVRIVASRPILEEYERVGARLTRRFPGVEVAPFIQLLMVTGEFFMVPDLPKQVCEDPEDDKFVACALGGGANMIVSGDRALLRIDGFSGIRVLSPRRFVDEQLAGA